MIALVDWQKDAVKEAISLCQGFAEIKSGGRVLIKPNLPLGGKDLRRFPGIYTDPKVVEEIITLLLDFSIRDIAVGEATVLIPAVNSMTMTAFDSAGYTELSHKYRVKLLDLNQSRFVEHSFEGKTIEIASEAFEYDYLINVPCLKTHSQTGISLGMKNLKGLLSMNGKKYFHQNGLSRLIAALNRIVKTDLVVVDGQRAMDFGPLNQEVKKANLVFAGRDIFEADIVGARLMCLNPDKIDHLVHYAQLSGRSIHEPIEIRGRSIENLQIPCRWEDDNWNDLCSRFGLMGMRIKRDLSATLCSLCLFSLLLAFSRFRISHNGYDFKGIELVLGKNKKAYSDTQKTILFGDCAVEINSRSKNKILLSGCPPEIDQIIDVLEGL